MRSSRRISTTSTGRRRSHVNVCNELRGGDWRVATATSAVVLMLVISSSSSSIAAAAILRSHRGRACGNRRASKNRRHHGHGVGEGIECLREGRVQTVVVVLENQFTASICRKGRRLVASPVTSELLLSAVPRTGGALLSVVPNRRSGGGRRRVA